MATFDPLYCRRTSTRRTASTRRHVAKRKRLSLWTLLSLVMCVSSSSSTNHKNPIVSSLLAQKQQQQQQSSRYSNERPRPTNRHGRFGWPLRPFRAKTLPNQATGRGDSEEESKETTSKSNVSNEVVYDKHRTAMDPTDILLLSRRPWTAVRHILEAAWDDKERLARYAITSIQYGLIVYLARSIWKAMVDVMEELNQETGGVGGFGFLDSAISGGLAKPAEVAKVLDFMEKFSKEGAVPSSSMPPYHLIQLAQKLLVSGLPLRTTAPGMTSVESVMLQLTKAELNVLNQCLWTPPIIAPTGTANNTTNTMGDSVQSVWSQIAGLYPIKERLLLTISTLRQGGKSITSGPEHAFASLFDTPSSSTSSTGVVSPGKGSPVAAGILLYGPPGCGKTMLVRALATTARVPCLVVAPSLLLRKYVGETNTQVRTLFQLAQKLAPCILCIDELDGLFRERNSDSEHDVSRDLKTEFLQWWDGMLSSTPSTKGAGTDEPQNRAVVVIGASNRPFDVDGAVLRRLSQSHFVGLPDVATRSVFLRQLLSNVPTEDDLDYRMIALQTEGYSPSDLRQLLQTAAHMGPMRDAALSAAKASLSATNESRSIPSPRPLSTQDVLVALQHTPPTPLSAAYRMALSNFASQRTQPSQESPSVFLSDRNLNQAAFRDHQHNPNAHFRWETDWGNFYNIGTLEMDSHTFDNCKDILEQHMQEQLDRQEEEEDNDNDPGN